MTSVSADVAGPLVGDREVADLLHGVAEEVDADRVLLGWREDVDDAAAYGELAAPLDQIDPDVRGADQGGREVAEVEVLADRQPDRLQLGQPLDLRLQHAADRGHDDLSAAAARRCRPAGGARASRRPTVSDRGLSRSCGSVSQAG